MKAVMIARYDFGETRVARLTLLTFTALSVLRSCGVVITKFSGHAATFRSSPTVLAETPMLGSTSTRILSGKPPRAIWSAGMFLGLYRMRAHLPLIAYNLFTPGATGREHFRTIARRVQQCVQICCGSQQLERRYAGIRQELAQGHVIAPVAKLRLDVAGPFPSCAVRRVWWQRPQASFAWKSDRSCPPRQHALPWHGRASALDYLDETMA
jgi:hypothetical protein